MVDGSPIIAIIQFPTFGHDTIPGGGLLLLSEVQVAVLISIAKALHVVLHVVEVIVGVGVEAGVGVGVIVDLLGAVHGAAAGAEIDHHLIPETGNL